MRCRLPAAAAAAAAGRVLSSTVVVPPVVSLFTCSPPVPSIKALLDALSLSWTLLVRSGWIRVFDASRLGEHFDVVTTQSRGALVRVNEQIDSSAEQAFLGGHAPSICWVDEYHCEHKQFRVVSCEARKPLWGWVWFWSPVLNRVKGSGCWRAAWPTPGGRSSADKAGAAPLTRHANPMTLNLSPTTRCPPERHPLTHLLAVGVLTALCATAMPAQAQWHGVVHTVSYHFSSPDHGRWNGNNWGLGLRREFSDITALQAGAYRNSNFETTAYVIGEWLPLRHPPLQAGVFGGAVSGYKLPLVAGLVARAQLGRTSAALRFVPKAYKSGSAALALEFGYRF